MKAVDPHVDRLQRERDTFEQRLNRLDERMQAYEDALRIRRAEVDGHIAMLKRKLANQPRRDAADKAQYRRIKERIQIEWYKRDEQGMIATRAGVKL